MSLHSHVSKAQGERTEASREAMTMVLYLSIVLLATFFALPSGGEASGDGHSSGIHGVELIELIWGTTIGLAAAHWFAFRLTARVFGGGKVSDSDIRVGVAQLAGAAFVAVLCSIPVLLVGDQNEVRVTAFVPALVVGGAGYLVARAGDRTKTQALILGGIVMILGLTVATLKNVLAGH
jgi:hypothetical protein